MTAFSRVLYTVISGALLCAAILLMAVAIWQTATGFWTGEAALDTMLDGIGLIIIAVAVADVGKFLFEEEVIADRELRRPAEARGSLTKFMTIIIVALSLESLVLITKATRETPANVMSPAMLMLVAVAAMVGLGLFQRLSHRVTAEVPDAIEDAEEDGGEQAETSPEPRRKPRRGAGLR